MDYNSKYTGEQVEELLDKINGSPEDIATPTGNYPDMTVGKASQADTATRAINADNATKAASATTADRATQATTADKATTADYATIAGQATTAESAKTATNAGRATTAEHATTAESATHADAATKADFATDLSGRIEATPEVFTYRPSAGEKSIKDDNAFIRRVKGNSVVWNNKVQLTNTATSKGGITVTGDSDGLLLNGTATGDTLIRLVDVGYYNYIGGHKYFLSYHTTGYNSGQVQFVDYSLAIYLGYNVTSGIFDVSTTARCNLLIIVTAGTTLENYRISGVILTDLTQMFGIGNEPNNIEEFRALYPDSYYPYNAGELRNLDCSGIKTVGFNQWDEQWESGVYRYWSDGLKSDNAEYIRSANFIRVIPANTYCLNIAPGVDTGVGFYDEYNNFLGYASFSYSNNSRLFQVPVNCQKITFYTKATTYNNDICINLSHTGVRDGEYEPYKEVTHTLPLSQITNGEPLRKAGSVYDEINETHYIKRVGVRPYAEGDENDATLLSDGTNTNYPLAEPIVTPIETPIDFNYYVEDFGTEEALLTEDSAPFSADVVYQFNATDQIRNNTRNIHKLQKSALIPRGTSAQYIRGDGSYGDIVELSQSTPINNGEFEMTDEGDRQFILTPNYYAKSQVTLDNTTTIAVFVTAPEDSHYLAEYWFEFAVDETLPNIEYYQPNNSDAVFRIDGDMMTDAVNILHLISSDGGNTFFGEIRSYSL